MPTFPSLDLNLKPNVNIEFDHLQNQDTQEESLPENHQNQDEKNKSQPSGANKQIEVEEVVQE